MSIKVGLVIAHKKSKLLVIERNCARGKLIHAVTRVETTFLFKLNHNFFPIFDAWKQEVLVGASFRLLSLIFGIFASIRPLYLKERLEFFLGTTMRFWMVS